MPDHVLDELTWRGLLAHTTDLAALREQLDAGEQTLYCGFDPTAPSLHIGNLLQLLTVRRLQLAGHRPLALVGGSTGMIGDPKESGERTLNSAEEVAGWVDRIKAQVSGFLSFHGEHAAIVVNNLDWTASLSTLDFLRDVGKHFPVNRMLDRQVVATRLDAGISYTEFSYVLLQSLDYLELHRRHGCVLQTGGSDQWGNITAGVELVRRVTGDRVHALATPLVTRADGTKFGKTESGTVWLDPEMTSPYAFHQFWLNAEDSMTAQYLRMFTFLSAEEIDKLERSTLQRPQDRAAQRRLATEVTTLVHGAEQARAAEAAAAALFGRGDLRDLDQATLRAVVLELGVVTVPAEAPRTVVDLLVASGLCDTRSAARRAVDASSVSVNNTKIDVPDWTPAADDLLHGETLVLRRGRRHMSAIQLAGRQAGIVSANQPR